MGWTPLSVDSGSFIPNELHPFSKSLLGPEMAESCCGQTLMGIRERGKVREKKIRRQFSLWRYLSLESFTTISVYILRQEFHLVARAYLEVYGKKYFKSLHCHLECNWSSVNDKECKK